MPDQRFRYPLWVRGDVDGFFGLMVDNLAQVLLIIGLCTAPFLCNLPASLVYQRILPGVAVSLLLGNLFYGCQAHFVARRDRNAACTALPYGINTPSVFAFVLFVMAPVYRMNEAALGESAAADLAWKAGMLACLVSGVIEFCGAFFAERLRRVTPRAALLGVLAAVGITFIASDFAFKIYTKPLVGLLPLGFLLLAYFGRYRFPFGLPGGLLVIAFGTALAWATTWTGLAGYGGVEMSGAGLRDSLSEVRLLLPVFCGGELLAVLSRPEILVSFLTVSIPMGLLNVLGSLQNIESAEAGGDRYATGPSLAVNGLGTLAAGLFGSCFPTTIYIGHPGWKSMGARAGYSIVNGAFFTLLFLFGCGTFLKELIPLEAGAPIVMYIGIVITAQAFQTTPREHAPAVVLALFPALAALLIVKFPLLLLDVGATTTLADVIDNPNLNIPELPGLARFGADPHRDDRGPDRQALQGRRHLVRGGGRADRGRGAPFVSVGGKRGARVLHLAGVGTRRIRGPRIIRCGRGRDAAGDRRGACAARVRLRRQRAGPADRDRLRADRARFRSGREADGPGRARPGARRTRIGD